MLQCVEDTTTASHRPWLAAYLLAQNIYDVGSHREPDEPVPSSAAKETAINLIASVPSRLLGDADVSAFYGEVHLSWMRRYKQIVLMCFPNQGPLVHHYERIPGNVSKHNIENASAERLAHWLGWLNE